MSDPKGQQNFQSNMRQLAMEKGLRATSSKLEIDAMVRDILRRAYRYESFDRPLTETDKAFNKRVEDAYQKHTGQKFPPFNPEGVVGAGFMGPPGHGKTTAFEQAAKKAAALLGQKFVKAAQLDRLSFDQINDDIFVFYSLQTAGVVSALEFLGLPNKEEHTNPDGTTGYSMGRLYSKSLMKLQRAGASLLVFDDALNAQAAIQDTMLELTLNASYNGLDLTRTYMGMTGNLGAADGSNASRPSSALRGRLAMAMIVDSVEDMAERFLGTPEFADELGSGFVGEFLSRHPEFFAELPNASKFGPFCAPRSWTRCAYRCREVFYGYGGRENAQKAIPEVQSVVQSMVGLEAAQKFSTFLMSMLNNADPIARQVVLSEKELKPDEVKELVTRYGNSSESHGLKSQHFNYMLAMSMSDYAIQRIKKDGDFRTAIKRWGLLAATLDPVSRAYSLEYLASNIGARCQDVQVTVEGTKQALGVKGNSTYRVAYESAEEMGHILKTVPNLVDTDFQQVMAKILSQASMYEKEGSHRPTATRAVKK